jgi:hypothetical protein
MTQRIENFELSQVSPEGEDAGYRIDWPVMLVIFMRLSALIWLAKGLFFWAQMLGAIEFGAPFEVRPMSQQAAIIYFSVIDLIAAVGLWLTCGWGGVLWILAVVSTIVLAFLLPSTFIPALWLSLFCGSMCLIYLVFSWKAAQTE